MKSKLHIIILQSLGFSFLLIRLSILVLWCLYHIYYGAAIYFLFTIMILLLSQYNYIKKNKPLFILIVFIMLIFSLLGPQGIWIDDVAEYIPLFLYILPLILLPLKRIHLRK